MKRHHEPRRPSRSSKTLLLSLACLIACALMATPRAAQANILGQIRDSISSLWSQKSGKQQKARAARSQAQAIDAKADALHDHLENTQRSLQQANEYYFNYWRQMRRTEAQIVRTRHRLHLVTERYNRRRVLFGRRLAAMQRSGKLSYLQVFLGSNTMSDLTRRSQLYQTITARDAELQSGLRDDKAELQHQQNYLASQWGERNRLQRAAFRERQRIWLASAAQERMLKQLHASRNAQLAYVEAEVQSSRELEGMITSLEGRRAEIIQAYEEQAARERVARLAYERRQARRYPLMPRAGTRYARTRYRRDRSGYRRVRYQRESDARDEGELLAPMPLSGLPRVDNDGPPVRSEHFEGDGHNHADDGWSAPVRGRLSSRYGMRYHPILRRRKMHTGDDLAAAQGSPIKAAHSGRVLWAGWKKAYGNTIIIDDGNGTQTLYGHASKLGVRPGQPIRRGEYIGNVGSTGYSTGPHLHFEVRKKGKPIDPTRYLRGNR
ncbi:MAG TPA: peptidoglycan DD-metalloendopeptidase family protein [Abditibacteriaceae bacterium]|jgi:murein DD-endopeptidase MepM/ murein hydrolase activator NlpD